MSVEKTSSTGEYLPPKERYALGALPMTGLFAVVSTALGLGLNRSGVESKLADSLPSLNGWGGPGLIFVASGFLNQFAAGTVMQARLKHDVPWPTLYATTYPSDTEETKTKNHLYNCVQRGHQHYLEFVPGFFALVALAGSKFPVLTTAFGLVSVVGRLVAFLGYASGDAKKKDQGAFGYLAMIPLAGLAYAALAKHLKLID